MNQGNFAYKSVVARKKLGSRDQRPLHRKDAKSAKNFGRGEASLAPTKTFSSPALRIREVGADRKFSVCKEYWCRVIRCLVFRR